MGVAVEGELGYAPRADIDEADPPCNSGHTTVAGAKGYVNSTGVDFLAVSIGNIYGRMKAKVKLDWVRLKEINAALGIPLVINGDSGLSDDQFRKLVTMGVAKINFYFSHSRMAGERIAGNAKQDGGLARHSGMRDIIAAEAERCMRVLGSAGRAAEVLAQCRPWLNVENVVLYSVPKLDDERLHNLILEGQQLITIPGVRSVQVGSFEDKGNRYGYCWLIRLASIVAVETYKNHPAQLAFAERLFRLVAADRISVDYCVMGIDHTASMQPAVSAPAVAGGPA